MLPEMMDALAERARRSGNRPIVLTGVGTSSNGEIYVGMTWGPASPQTPQLFLSLSPL